MNKICEDLNLNAKDHFDTPILEPYGIIQQIAGNFYPSECDETGRDTAKALREFADNL
tara:strand:+ start:406 stop:579 length:174 start_codon:yes stop_codon:yes gene_type:complete